MIALDADFVGSLAPPPKVTLPGGGTPDVPFARLPRLERLRVSGKLDEPEELDGDGVDAPLDEEAVASSGDKKLAREKKEKLKMRGKNKATKRYLRKHRKNVIDPATVAIRAKLEKQREARRKALAEAKGDTAAAGKPSALDRFKQTS